MAEITERDKLSGRIGRLESGFESISDSVRNLARIVETNARETREIIHSLGEKFSSSQKTAWGPIFQAVSTALAIIAIIGTLVAFAINTKIDYNARAIEKLDFLESRGDPRHDERIKFLEKLTEELRLLKK